VRISQSGVIELVFLELPKPGDQRSFGFAPGIIKLAAMLLPSVVRLKRGKRTAGSSGDTRYESAHIIGVTLPRYGIGLRGTRLNGYGRCWTGASTSEQRQSNAGNKT
jgi:hypothetical protein